MRRHSCVLINLTARKSSILSNLLDILLKFLFPVCSIVCEYLYLKKPIDPSIIAKWFVFWGMGIFFLTTGLLQLIKPEYMMQQFNPGTRPINPESSRSTGILFIAVGILAAITLYNIQNLKPASIIALVYFGMGSISNFSVKPGFHINAVRLITDLLLFSSSLLFLFYSIFST